MRTTALQSEQNLQTHLEKENHTIAFTVSKQINQLKQAIGTLADAVSEELEGMKQTVIMDLETKAINNQQKLDHLYQTLNTQNHDSSKLIFEINTLKDEVATLQAIEAHKTEHLEQKMDAKLVSLKSDHKYFSLSL